MQELINKLSHLSVSRLEAMYNEAWRRRHNEIEPDKHHTIMQGVELVCGVNAIEITGRGGSFEFVETKKGSPMFGSQPYKWQEQYQVETIPGFGAIASYYDANRQTWSAVVSAGSGKYIRRKYWRRGWAADGDSRQDAVYRAVRWARVHGLPVPIDTF